MTATILLVDDNDGLAEALADFLEADGYRVQRAVNARQALASAATTPLGLGVVDVRLPEMDGYTLCAALQQHDQLPIILMTGADTEQEGQRAAQAGAAALLRKPFPLEEFREMIGRFLPAPGACRL